MTFKQFAFNNVKRNTRQYLSYFLSCTFAVIVFFMYAVVVFHPDIAETDFRDIVQLGIIVSEVIIYLFSFLFVLYSTGSFIKSRKKEYGLLTTLGISKSQLNRMLILENTIIGLASIVTGILAGTVLTKLFLMVFSAVLGLEEILPFYVSFKAILLTAVLFFIMFELNSLAVVWTLRTKSVMEVFRGAKTPKRAPRFSWIVSIIALGAIGYAYYLAYTSTLMSMVIRMIPILALIIPGTYFLFSQFSIAFTTILKKNKRFYYNKLNLLTVSDLTFKLKDNARLLFFVTILSAIAFTSSGVLYGIFQSVQTEVERNIPQDVTLIGKGADNTASFQAEVNYVEKAFQEENIPFESLAVQSTEVQAKSDMEDWDDVRLMAYSYSDFKSMVALNSKEVPFDLTGDTSYVLTQGALEGFNYHVPDSFEIVSNNEAVELPVIERHVSLLNSNYYTTFHLIVPDDVFDRFYQVADADEIYHHYAMNIPNWTKYATETEQILGSVDMEGAYPDSQANAYTMLKEGTSYLFFFGIFISVLFFLAAGSILYFRIYQDIDKDLHHFHSLYRIGLTDKEMKKIATKQLGLLFFIPFIVAVIHAAFAFKALQNMLASSVLLPSITVIAFFFIVHFANFIFIRNIYTGKLKKVM